MSFTVVSSKLSCFFPFSDMFSNQDSGADAGVALGKHLAKIPSQLGQCLGVRGSIRSSSWEFAGNSVHTKKVGGLEPWNFMTFHLLGIIIPTDKLIFFRGVETTNQYKWRLFPNDMIFGCVSKLQNYFNFWLFSLVGKMRINQ